MKHVVQFISLLVNEVTGIIYHHHHHFCFVSFVSDPLVPKCGWEKGMQIHSLHSPSYRPTINIIFSLKCQELSCCPLSVRLARNINIFKHLI